MKTEERICPVCGKTYTDQPAISRIDNETPICPDCGTREALKNLDVPEDEIDEIIEKIHNATVNET